MTDFPLPLIYLIRSTMARQAISRGTPMPRVSPLNRRRDDRSFGSERAQTII
jgi:hypothetical protein